MKWNDLPWYDKVGEIVAGFCVFAIPILLLFLAEAFK